MDVAELQRRAYANSEAHGFWDDWFGVTDHAQRELMFRLIVNEKIALIHSELSEALEEIRSARDSNDYRQIRTRESDGKPEGFAVELADAIIRIADLADGVGVDLSAALARKLAFNESRPHKHGRAC